MGQITVRQWSSYWRLAWRHKPSSKLFAPYRAVPSVAIAALVFLFRRLRDNRTSPKEMWIAAFITVGVYLLLYVAHAFFSFFSLSPVLMDANRIGVLNRQQERQLESVRERLETFSEEERSLLRFILDNGIVGYLSLASAGFPSELAFEAVRKAKLNALIIETRKPRQGQLEELLKSGGTPMFQINPALEPILSRLLDDTPSKAKPK